MADLKDAPNYEEEALNSLRSGDFAAAAALLKRAVEENGFTFPVLNNAYTVACIRRAGDLN